MSEQPGRDRHQRQTLILLIVSLVAILTAVGISILFATQFDRIVFLHFPLGFYILAQGVLIVMVAIAFWAANAQEHIDNTLAESEED